MSARKPAWLALLGAFVASGCATQQAVPIECVSETVEIYVDGRLIEGNPGLLTLSANDPHTVFIKAEGYEPQLVALVPEPGPDGEMRLTPDNVCVELVPVGQGRALEIEVDEPAR